MASLADLFNPSFLMFLGILVLVAALLVVYFESKIRDQNHKIASMLSLVSTLAEDMNGVKMTINHLAMTAFSGGSAKQFFQEQSLEEEEEEETNAKSNKLIHVSDDETADDDDDDSNSDNDSDAESELQLNSESDSNSECDCNCDFEDNDNIEELLEHSDLEVTNHNDIKVLKLNIENDEIKGELEDLEDNLSDSQSVNLEINIELPSQEIAHSENDVNNLIGSNLKSININLEETESLDYKKLPLPKLRSIVSEKGLSSDVSKLKKLDLLKLLEVE